jgi:arginyl-tRNA synthetase
VNILQELHRRFAAALSGMADNPADLLAQVRASQDPKFGDYQANCAMPLGKRLGKPPKEIAKEIVSRLDVADLCDPPEIAGPGFINLRLKSDFLASQAAAASVDPRVGVPTVEKPRTYIVDYSAPNVAKPMHVGHIRSTVIGDCLYRTLNFAGHNPISDNHLGDWGTQFGMIIYGYKHPELSKNTLDILAEADEVYRKVNTLVGYERAQKRLPKLKRELEIHRRSLEDAESRAAAGDHKAKSEIQRLKRTIDRETDVLGELKQIINFVDRDQNLLLAKAIHKKIGIAVLRETARLHTRNPTSLRMWRTEREKGIAKINVVYDRLKIAFDYTIGESFYHNRLAPLVLELLRKEIARVSNKAVGVFFNDEPGAPPFLIQKRDGAFLYATTDLATIQYRIKRWRPDAILYVVDHRQSLHFQHLFKTVTRWKPKWANVEFKHISFGTVLGKDGKPFKTRSGDTVGLESLLNEGVNRALTIVSTNDDAKSGGSELSPEERQKIAEAVGIGALKYADLSQNRTSDYVFDYDKMLAMNGNTATYMQYAHARIRGIFIKGQKQLGESSDLARPCRSGEIILAHPAERALALAALQLSEAIDLVLADYRPNQLTNYLFELANRFSTFYENCPVLRADTPELLHSRLALCDLTAKVLRQGLELLGIEVVERM